MGKLAKLRKRTIARARLLTLLLFVVSVGYVAFAVLRYLSYQDRIREILLSYPEELRPWMDFFPFTSTREGSLIMVGGYLLVATWLFLALFLMIIGKTARKENQQILAPAAICVLD